MKVAHIVAGNRLRIRATVKLEADVAWKPDLTIGEKRVAWYLSAHLLRHYDYENSF